MAWTSSKARKLGFRSMLEVKIADSLKQQMVNYEYEAKHNKVKYTQPAKTRTYNPDFVLDNGVILEVKGRFTAADRQKHKLIKEQHPELDIRLVFQRPQNPIRKGSKTTYAAWCDKHCIPWCGQQIPKEWFI